MLPRRKLELNFRLIKQFTQFGGYKAVIKGGFTYSLHISFIPHPLWIKNASMFTCSSFVIALQASSSRFRCLFFFLGSRQGELGILGMTSESTSLPLAMSLPGNFRKVRSTGVKESKNWKLHFKYGNTFYASIKVLLVSHGWLHMQAIPILRK